MDNQEKNALIKALIDRGIAAGKINSTDIDTVLVEADVDVDEMEKVYSKLEAAGVEIVDDLSDEIFENINQFLKEDIYKDGYVNEGSDFPPIIKRHLDSMGVDDLYDMLSVNAPGFDI